MAKKKRTPPYPRVVFDDRYQRVVFTSRSDIVIEQAAYDALGERAWITASFDIKAPPPWFTMKLLTRLLTIARRKSRRSRRRVS